MSNAVLIVENQVEARNMMKFIVQSYGYEVIEATNGYEAIEQTMKHHPELILMDLVLPQIDAAATTKIIRELEGFDNVSIVALTEFRNTCFEKVIEVGFDDVLVNPLCSDYLEPILERYAQ